MIFNYIKIILFLLTCRSVISRKCVDPVEHLSCCKDILNLNQLEAITKPCMDYHLDHSPAYNTTKSCKKLYCKYDCAGYYASIVCFNNLKRFLIKIHFFSHRYITVWSCRFE